ncbi:MAG: hypothetical protein EXR48_02455 [Dehalococcoidia bacterium]|nr:hypothetical protein [Dehalococcoidia bacterium]
MAVGNLDKRLGYSGDTCDRLAQFLLPHELPLSYAVISKEMVNERDFQDSDLRRDLARFTEEGWLDRRRSKENSENFYLVTTDGRRALKQTLAAKE